MKKSCFLCLLFFSGSSFAVGLSDDKKRAFIESLAIPSSEEQVFYRWQPASAREKLLEAGEMTLELYEHYVGKKSETKGLHLVGQGLYVSEDMSSSSNYGETIVKVVLERGYPFIDLNDVRVQKQLQEKGIGLEEAYLLKPRVAVRDHGLDSWWCLKRREGIRFEPVSNQELMENFKQAHLSIGEDGKKRFFNLLSKQEQKQLIDGIENFFDGLDIFFVARNYFSETEMTEIVNAIIPHITDVQLGVLCLNIGWDSLSKKDKGEIMNKTLSYIKTEEDMEALHKEIKKQFLVKDYNQIFTEFQAVLQQKAEQVKGSSSILPDFSQTFSEDELKQITGNDEGTSSVSDLAVPFSENELKGVRNTSMSSSQTHAGSEDFQDSAEKPHERKLTDAIQESITSGKELDRGAITEYVLESIRCSDLWKSN